MNGLWVFGYGSLMWEPGFAWDERLPARLDGWHRSFCMRSIHYRGTEERPGLVLALDAAVGGACHGVGYAIAAGQAEQALAYLRERELVSSAYLERMLAIELADGRRVEAVTYVIDPGHRQYCGGIPLEDQARIIFGATGQRGPNRDYLWNTAAHLGELGIADPELDWLAARVRALASGGL